jgi:hypothetical protein
MDLSLRMCRDLGTVRPVVVPGDGRLRLYATVGNSKPSRTLPSLGVPA